MHIVGLELRNWLRFRGTHRLKLGADVYGVTARWHDDTKRSNFGGKTATLEAIRFALRGEHRKRTEDEWITRNEDEGGVKLLLEDGGFKFLIDRHRERGKSTKLELTIFPRAEKSLYGDEAQLAIDRMLGFKKEDDLATWYVGQKQASKMLTEDPGERLRIVSAWFGLAPLAEAAESVADQLSELLEKESELGRQRAANEQFAKQVWEREGVADEDALAPLLGHAVAESIRLADVRDLFERQLEEQQETRLAFERAREYHAALEAGKELRRRIDGYFPGVPTEEHLEGQRALLAKLTREEGVAERNVQQKRRLALGEWDRRCPLVSIVCPAAPEVAAEGSRNRVDLSIAAGAHNAAAAERQRLAQALIAEERARHQFETDARERERLKAEVLRLRPHLDATVGLRELDPAQVEQTRRNLTVARQNLQDRLAEVARLRSGLELIARQRAAYERAGAEAESLVRRVSLLREAHQVLQRARRQIAEENVAEIELLANRALAGAGIGLQVRCTWARESKEPARHCDCGMAFPASAKVKACARCGSPRGKHLVEKFEISTSDESGATEDLGGIFVQLAATAWLRRDRGAAWTVAVLDEPMASLDVAHRTSMAGALPRLLRELGFTQVFVCAHDSSLMAGMPAIVQVVAEENGSRFEGEEHDGEHSHGNEDRARGDAEGLRDDVRQAGSGSPRADRADAQQAAHHPDQPDAGGDLGDGAGARRQRPARAPRAGKKGHHPKP